MARIPLQRQELGFAGPRFVTSFAVDEHTSSLIEAMMASFGVATPAEVVQRALALAKLISDNISSENTVTLQAKDGPLIISLSGRTLEGKVDEPGKPG